jgi:hypothetical protein
MNVSQNGCHSYVLTENDLIHLGIKSETSLSTSLHNTMECPMEHGSLQNACHVSSVAIILYKSSTKLGMTVGKREDNSQILDLSLF